MVDELRKRKTIDHSANPERRPSFRDPVFQQHHDGALIKAALSGYRACRR
jgi:hypothetical protein